MKAYRPAIAAAVITAALLSIVSSPAASPKKPAGSISYDQAFSEAFRDYWQWTLVQTKNSDSPLPHGKRVCYLPVPAPQVGALDGAEIGCSEVDVTVAPGVRILVSGFACIGEIHADGRTDPPWLLNWLLPPYGEVTITLDGEVLVAPSNMASHTFGPIPFEEPIAYATPSESGGIAAAWVEGIGVILPQLRLGKHTLTVTSWNAFSSPNGGNVVVYNLNIVPPGRK